jgi:hypothetical protein
MPDYYGRALGDKAKAAEIDHKNAVTLEISALQYFPWLIAQARRSIDEGELMPGRYIRVRNMAEQETDNGDIMATAAAMQIIGASYVETLDTKGTDGSNIHLGGPETITGYFGGVGQPNEYPLNRPNMKAVRWTLKVNWSIRPTYWITLWPKATWKNRD